MPVLWWDTSSVRDKIARGATIGALAGAHLVHDEALRRMRMPKSGRVYRRRGVTHQASAPGEAPAIDTGRLAQSASVIPDPANHGALVNFSDRKALMLEKGTRKMAPRPFAMVSLLAMSAQVRDRIARGIAEALR